MNARLIINNIEIVLGHRLLEDIVYSLNDEAAMREVFQELAGDQDADVARQAAKTLRQTGAYPDPDEDYE